MNKLWTLSLLASLLFHGVLFISFNKNLFQKKIVYSKNIGKASIKIKLTQTIVKKEKIEPLKKSTKKIQDKTPKKKNQKNVTANNAKEKSTAGDEVLMNKYLSEVRSAIAKNKYKSPMATRLKLTGSVKMQFLIKRPAMISDIKVIEASRFSQLNDSAVQTIQSTSDIPIIPEEIKLNEIPLTLVITYE